MVGVVGRRTKQLVHRAEGLIALGLDTWLNNQRRNFTEDPYMPAWLRPRGQRLWDRIAPDIKLEAPPCCVRVVSCCVRVVRFVRKFVSLFFFFRLVYATRPPGRIGPVDGDLVTTCRDDVSRT